MQAVSSPSGNELMPSSSGTVYSLTAEYPEGKLLSRADIPKENKLAKALAQELEKKHEELKHLKKDKEDGDTGFLVLAVFSLLPFSLMLLDKVKKL